MPCLQEGHPLQCNVMHCSKTRKMNWKNGRHGVEKSFAAAAAAASIRWRKEEKKNYSSNYNLTFDFHGVHFTVTTMRATAHIETEYWIWSGEHRQQMQCVFFLFFFYYFSSLYLLWFFFFLFLLLCSPGRECYILLARLCLLCMYLSKVRSQFDLSHSPIAC